MKTRSLIAYASLFAIVAGVGVSFASVASAESDQASIARGGRLYDKWTKVLKVEDQKEPHKLYPETNEKYAKDAAANWRCKECHGWDGLGAAGAYSSGSHATGIKGINGMIGGDPAKIVEILKGDHGYGDKLAEQDMTDLANFVVAGQIDWSIYVSADKKIIGDPAAGKQVFETVCANCHGLDGKLPKDIPPLGSLTSNPWEVMHKVLNGQPGEVMPALRAIDHSVAANLVAYLATLPAE